jgi:large subunit ribosomal protein L10
MIAIRGLSTWQPLVFAWDVALRGGEMHLAIPKKEPRPEKVQEVANLKELLNAGTVILTDYHGLDVKSISDLRRKLRAAGSGYRVVKNTLLTLAAAETSFAALAEGLRGQTALCYTDGDPIAAAKALQEFVKGAKPIHIKSGLVDGQVLSADQIESLSKIAGKQELYAMVVGGLQGPIYGLVGTLSSMMGQLVMTLQGVADKQAAAA